jgi:adenylyltransferase/sulfurtransferase
MNGIDPEWEVSVQDVKAKLDGGDDFLLLDVRQPEEHAVVNIDGAKLVPLGTLRSALPELNAHQAGCVVTFCHHGGRSMEAARVLRASGFADVKSMAGGIDTWAEQIDPSKPRY